MRTIFSRLLGLLSKIIYKIRFGRSVSFSGIPKFVSHMQIFISSGSVKIGQGFTMKQGVYIAAIDGGEINIGDNVSINRNCLLVCHDLITIDDNCAIGPNTVFYDHDHKFGENGIAPGFNTAPILVEKNCWIGAGVTILRGTTIGEGCVIGAGCVIKGNIPPHSLVTADRKLVIQPINPKGEKI